MYTLSTKPCMGLYNLLKSAAYLPPISTGSYKLFLLKSHAKMPVNTSEHTCSCICSHINDVCTHANR